MRGATIKIVNAQQAKLNKYKNTKLKLLKTNAFEINQCVFLST